MPLVWTRGCLLACLVLTAAIAMPAGAWDGADGVVTVLPWSGPGSVDLSPLAKEGWIVAHNQDLAVLLLPRALAVPGELQGTLREVGGPLDGTYYLLMLADADGARLAGDARVLARQGHTLLALTAGEPPQLTADSRAEQWGLIQPLRISLTPKAWPATAPRAGGPRERTEFHPLVDQIVGEVALAEYVAKWQVLDDFETRYYNTAQNTASSQWMYDYFVSLGIQAQFHAYQQSGTRRNVIGILPGVVQPEKVVYICGHFDSISEMSQTSAPGADDNGSGTAAFLEAARVLSQYAFHYTIKFAGFNGEEQGLVGSDAYATYIAGLGEDVVGCFNLDMIAYRGTDPAPADLVIYTDNNSIELAELLEDACLEYFPTDLEPLVTVSSMTGSDHASFWSQGYKAICGIEDEAWGNDFCPWYHTSDDRIERYPQDYPTHCTAATIAAVAQMATPMQPNSPYLVLGDLAIDDDAVGASIGNANGVVEFSETIELRVTLENLGLVDALNVTGRISTADSYIVLRTASAGFGTIGSGGSAVNAQPFVFAVRPDVPDGHLVRFDLAVSEQPDTLRFTLPVAAADLAVVAYEADDTVGGDGDGIPEPGETVAVTISLSNQGGAAVTDVSGTLIGGAHLTADPTPIGFGSLTPGATATGGPFSVLVEPACPVPFGGALTVALAGTPLFLHNATFSFYVGDVFADDIESGALGWSHYVGGTGFSDQWHLESYRNHTHNGAYAWKCGGAGAGAYGNLLHAVLETPAFTLPAGAVLTFWHWIDAETSGSYPDRCYDGGLLEISIDGGAWQSITPDGGYPYLIRTGGTPGPFATDTPVFSGQHGWQIESFDLAGHEGSARIRFRFGSDGADAGEGWYIDDLQLTFPISGAGEAGTFARLLLHPAQPNPTQASARLRLDLPQAAPVTVEVFDASGRRVRQLHGGVLDGGAHDLLWDGADDLGLPVGGGVYWVRAQALDQRRAVRVVVLR